MMDYPESKIKADVTLFIDITREETITWHIYKIRISQNTLGINNRINC